MIKRVAVAAIAVAGILSAVPASADEVGVGVGVGPGCDPRIFGQLVVRRGIEFLSHRISPLTPTCRRGGSSPVFLRCTTNLPVAGVDIQTAGRARSTRPDSLL